MEEIKSTALPLDPFYKDKDYNSLRRLKLIYISNAFNSCEYYQKLPYTEKLNYIMMIENSCLNETIRKAREYNIRCIWEEEQFVNIYHSICYNILSTINIKLATGSNILVERIFTQKIDLHNIASMPCKELCPEKYEEMTKKIKQRSNMEDNVKYTELYFCRKCKHNKCTAQQVQNRCNDEGSSYYITCLFCHNRWFGG